MANKPSKFESDAYYVTFFKVEGHSKWRAHFSANVDAFDNQRATWENPPKITEKRVYRFDKVSGTVDLKEGV